MLYKVFISLFTFITITSYADVLVMPLKNDVLKTGDVDWVKLEIDGVGELQINSLVGKYLCGKLYVLSFEKTDSEIFARVAVTTPTDSNVVACKYSGITIQDSEQVIAEGVKGIDYQHAYNLKDNYIWLRNLLALFGLMLLVAIVYFIYTNNRKKKLYIKNQRVLKQSIENANSRLEIEKIHESKELIFKYFILSEESWLSFKSNMDKIQFKESWTSEDLVKAQRSLNDFKLTLREKKWNFKI